MESPLWRLPPYFALIRHDFRKISKHLYALEAPTKRLSHGFKVIFEQHLYFRAKLFSKMLFSSKLRAFNYSETPLSDREAVAYIL